MDRKCDLSTVCEPQSHFSDSMIDLLDRRVVVHHSSGAKPISAPSYNKGSRFQFYIEMLRFTPSKRSGLRFFF